MRLHEIIKESVTFGLYKQDPENPKHFMMVGKNVEEACYACEGSCKDEDDPNYDCRYCNGTGKMSMFKADGPELNVSNTNAGAIIQELGLVSPADMQSGDWYCGSVEPKELPAFRQKLLVLLNSQNARRGMTVDPSIDRGEPRATKDDDGTSRISRGPTIIDGGRSESQIIRYAETLLKMAEYAMKYGLEIGWG